VMAYNLTRAAAAAAGNGLAKARTGTIRRKLINIPARIASSARKVLLHMPKGWPWETAFTDLFTAMLKPSATAPV
uniref:transposase n=1 Tax=Arthrobacter sp. H14 TaxID=1312959 RepID=UPI001565C8E9